MFAANNAKVLGKGGGYGPGLVRYLLIKKRGFDRVGDNRILGEGT
jgi:hypothetical protein